MQKVSSKAVYILTFGYLCGWFFPIIFIALAFATVVQEGPHTQHPNLAIAILAFIILLSLVGPYIWARIVYANYGFEMQNDTITVHQGVFNKSSNTIALRRIQDVQVTSNFIELLFGVASISIIGLAGFSANADIRYLDRAEALKMRDLLLEYLKNFDVSLGR